MGPGQAGGDGDASSCGLLQLCGSKEIKHRDQLAAQKVHLTAALQAMHGLSMWCVHTQQSSQKDQQVLAQVSIRGCELSISGLLTFFIGHKASKDDHCWHPVPVQL
jgi:hypothetical protein